MQQREMRLIRFIDTPDRWDIREVTVNLPPVNVLPGVSDIVDNYMGRGFGTLAYMNFGELHSCVFGITGSGKTYATLASLDAQRKGVLFFNIVQEQKYKEGGSLPDRWIEVNAKDNPDIDMLEDLLQRGEKINFVPSPNLEVAQLQIRGMINEFYKNRRPTRNFYFVIDECHLYKKEALSALKQIATTGRKFGLRAIFISQKGANVDNTLIQQSQKYFFFKTNLEEGYWEGSYGIPLTEINKRIVRAGKYSYCSFDLEKIEGAYKV